MADDVQCSRTALAVALGVSRSTLHRWIADDSAPRAACLAVFWLTRWGASTLDADAHNAAVHSAALARALRDELIKAQRQIARLQRAIDAAPGGAANRPVYSSVYLESDGLSA